MYPDRRLLARLLTLALALSPLACGDDDDDDLTAPPGVTVESTTFAPALNVNLAASTRTSSGLYYRDLTVGTGPVVTTGQRLSVRYTGWLSNGTQFQTLGPNDAPFPFTLGRGQVIAGWDEGVVGMRVGGTRQLVIPPSLGYGPSGNGPIPGNAVLVFTVTVVSAQ